MTVPSGPNNRWSHHVTVLIGDAQMLVRVGIRCLVQERLDSVTFLEAEDGDTLLRIAGMVAGSRLAVVDLTTPGMRGGHLLAELAHRHPDIGVIVISSLGSVEIMQRMMRIPSVCAFVMRSCTQEVMMDAIDAAMQRRKVTPVPASLAPAAALANLTPRQRQIRELLRQGLSNKMIAARLGISAGTVKNHITAVFRALNTTNRTQAAQFEVSTSNRGLTAS